ncbi:hypothetical protein LCGC14_0547730 [marine sediment metagenome]|uniref:Uncharacterized protein n=1 Tax=marine sediment metagenome TaxID=412755 RepID=A0A0F9UC93_9ZZZZ
MSTIKNKQMIIDEAAGEKSPGITSKRDPIPRQDQPFTDAGLPQWNVNFTYPTFMIDSQKKYEFTVTDIATGKVDIQEFIIPATGKFLIVRPILAIVDGEIPTKPE